MENPKNTVLTCLQSAPVLPWKAYLALTLNCL